MSHPYYVKRIQREALSLSGPGPATAGWDRRTGLAGATHKVGLLQISTCGGRKDTHSDLQLRMGIKNAQNNPIMKREPCDREITSTLLLLLLTWNGHCWAPKPAAPIGLMPSIPPVPAVSAPTACAAVFMSELLRACMSAFCCAHRAMASAVPPD